jgi:hypothetical protein
MIQKGSTVILRTRNAIYSPCEVALLHRNSVAVKYLAGMKKDRKTGKMVEDRRVETISRNDIVSMSERP